MNGARRDQNRAGRRKREAPTCAAAPSRHRRRGRCSAIPSLGATARRRRRMPRSSRGSPGKTVDVCIGLNEVRSAPGTRQIGSSATCPAGRSCHPLPVRGGRECTGSQLAKRNVTLAIDETSRRRDPEGPEESARFDDDNRAASGHRSTAEFFMAFRHAAEFFGPLHLQDRGPRTRSCRRRPIQICGQGDEPHGLTNADTSSPSR